MCARPRGLVKEEEVLRDLHLAPVLSPNGFQNNFSGSWHASFYRSNPPNSCTSGLYGEVLTGGIRITVSRLVAQIHRLPFDRLRANGDILKSFNFSAHAGLVEASN
jgi:hypothetical protein